MVKPINRDIIILSIPSVEAVPADLPVADDLLDTLAAHADGCVGMAANMIGVNKRIIAFLDGDEYTVMFNPSIIKSDFAYTANEGCLSLDGSRSAKRFKKIKVEYQNRNFARRIKSYSGFTAQIIQHELDHLDGVII